MDIRSRVVVMVTTQCCVVELRHKKHQAEQQTQRYKTQNTPKDETFEETLDPIRHLGQHEAFADEPLLQVKTQKKKKNFVRGMSCLVKNSFWNVLFIPLSDFLLM